MSDGNTSPDGRIAKVPDVAAPPPRHPRYPLTVGLRGVAALTILVGHAWFFTGGFGGFTESLPNRLVVRWDGVVALFFMLSAFLLYRPMIAQRNGGPPAPTIGAYALRRFLRLYPAYWVALTALAIVPGLYGVFSHHWWAFYSLTDFLKLSLHDVCPRNQEFRCGLPQSWTLGIDLTFYLALPLYAAATALIARGRSTRRWMQIELVVLAIAGGGVARARRPPARSPKPSVVPLQLPWLLLLVRARPRDRDYLGRLFTGAEAAARAAAHCLEAVACWGGAAAIYISTVLAFFDGAVRVRPVQDLGVRELVLLQGLCALLVFLPAVFANPNRGLPSRVIGHPVLMWFGLISYGLLLWHATVAVSLGTLGSGNGYWVVLVGEVVIAIPVALHQLLHDRAAPDEAEIPAAGRYPAADRGGGSMPGAGRIP